MDLNRLAGKRVLLKPNAGRIARAETGVTTHPQAVAAAIDGLRDAGIEVAIGESPISGVNTMEAFEVTGIAEVAHERECPLIDMDARPFVEVEIPDGIAIRRLRVCPEVLEFDLVVSVPVIKTHMHTGVSLCIKNMKGCLWRRSKVELHMLPVVEGREDKPIDIAIADMFSVLRPGLVIVDGYVAMEGLGPSAGTPARMNIALAGFDALAVDSVACALMGLDAADIPHLRIAAEKGLGTIDLDQIRVFPDNWRDFSCSLETPPENLSFEFPGVVVHDKNSCSACQSTLLMFLRRYGHRLGDYFPAGDEVHFAIGKGNDKLPDGCICLGNCTAMHRRSHAFLPGCPPVASQILSAISGQDMEDELDGHGR